MLGEIKMPRYKQSLAIEFDTTDDTPLYAVYAITAITFLTISK